jgi:hypothetical protein
MILKLDDLIEVRLTATGAALYNMRNVTKGENKATLHNGDLLCDTFADIMSIFGEGCKHAFAHDEVWLCDNTSSFPPSHFLHRHELDDE